MGKQGKKRKARHRDFLKDFKGWYVCQGCPESCAFESPDEFKWHLFESGHMRGRLLFRVSSRKSWTDQKKLDFIDGEEKMLEFESKAKRYAKRNEPSPSRASWPFEVAYGLWQQEKGHVPLFAKDISRGEVLLEYSPSWMWQP